jgi:hypothetical protein
VDLGRVGHDRAKVGRDVILQAMFFGNVSRITLIVSLEQVLDLDELAHAADALGKREDLAHELDAALGALLKGGDDAQVVGIGRVLPQDRARPG